MDKTWILPLRFPCVRCGLYAAVSERRANDRRWALEMAVLHHDRLDWDAVDALACANGIAEAARTLRTEAQAIAHP